MSLRTALMIGLISIAWILANCTRSQSLNEIGAHQNDAGFYSRESRESQVQFSALFLTNYKTVEEFKADVQSNVAVLESSSIPRLLRHLAGPLLTRGLGAIRKFSVKVDPESAYLTTSGTIAVRYQYTGTWLFSKKVSGGNLLMPVPYNYELIKTPKWLRCTDQEPAHQNEAFYFYFWDPTRENCDQIQPTHYQLVKVDYTDIENEPVSYPEYSKLLNSGDQERNLQMTFAYGYIRDVENPDPFKDADANIKNFRTFLEKVRYMAKVLDLQESPILQKEYLSAVRPEVQIGSRFVGTRNKIRIEIKVVAAAQIDQMEIFAKSYAHDHDAFFGWFGHSRVGSEMDANNFRYMVEAQPDYYSISKNYQIVYWAGCSSYAYYVNPFFAMKAAVNPEDKNGTKGLDLLSNGFSTAFAPYPDNAMVWLGALINWDLNFSYQKIIGDLEQRSTDMKRTILVNVIGDEDNQEN